MKVTFFDVEYANFRNKAICQIGILSKDLENAKENIEKVNLYINPNDDFDINCVKIHGITQEKVKNEKNIREAWGDIEKYFTNAVVIGHNVASTDLDALYKNLSKHGIMIPQIYYLCTYELAKQLVPAFIIPDYSLMSLCNFFNIAKVDYHNAFYDACACADLLDSLVNYSNIDITEEIKRFIPNKTEDFISYVSNASLKRDIHTLYGIVKGFSLDSIINEEEKKFLKEWKNLYIKYEREDIKHITSVIEQILEDNIVTKKEIRMLNNTIKKYLDINTSSPATIATQILNGIIKGMIADNVISEDECFSLSEWLYENSYLIGHFPFDKLCNTVEKIIEDEIISNNELIELKNIIDELLNPVENLKEEITSVKGKKVCLSGNFAYGQKSVVERYILEQGGIVESRIKKDTDILVVGDIGNNYYNIDNFDSKVKKALEYNEKGSSIQISREIDLIKPAKPFNEVLFAFIDERNLKDSTVYNKAQISRQIMSHIRNKPNYIPTKQNICALALAMELNIEETNQLLNSAGYSLSRSFEFDRVIEDAIRRKKYDIFELNEKLYDLGIEWLNDR